MILNPDIKMLKNRINLLLEILMVGVLIGNIISHIKSIKFIIIINNKSNN
jgi:hypothetical protein